MQVHIVDPKHLGSPMSFVGWIEHHRRSLIFVAVALALAGAYAAVSLPAELFPMVSFPRLRVNIESGSMPAQQMLVEVTEPWKRWLVRFQAQST